jgi:hypothetical protein
VWQAQAVTVDAARLISEAGRKSDVAWIGPVGGRLIGLWCEWDDDALLIVTDGGEQPAPGLIDTQRCVVTLRSKDKGVRVVTFEAVAHQLAPRSPEWEHAAGVLRDGRLNAPDHDTLLDRWANESGVWRLVPTGSLLEAPGRMRTDSQRAEPAPTPAVTSGAPPLMIGKRPPRRTGGHL